MDQEYYKHQGRLAEAEKEAKRIEINLSAARDSLRSTLDPFEKLADLNGDVIVETAISFAKLQIEYKEKLALIEALKKALRIR